MKKLIVLYHNHYGYYPPAIKQTDGLIKFLSEKELRMKDLEIVNISDVKISTKENKVLVKLSNKENVTYSLEDTNTQFFILTNKIKSKSVPKNVILISSDLSVNQEDGVGNIYKIDTDSYNDNQVTRILKGFIKSKLVKAESKYISKLNNLFNSEDENNLEANLHKESILYLLANLNKAKNKKTVAFLLDVIERILNVKTEYFNSGSSAYVALNGAIRNNKMSIDNSLSYQGFQYVDSLFYRYKELLNMKDNYQLFQISQDIISFIQGYITMMLADELEYYIKYPNSKEFPNKILYVNNEFDICDQNIEKVLPHMEKYIGYLNTSKKVGLTPILYMYRKYTDVVNKKILDHILKNKNLINEIILSIEYILDNDTYVKNQLHYNQL